MPLDPLYGWIKHHRANLCLENLAQKSTLDQVVIKNFQDHFQKAHALVKGSSLQGKIKTVDTLCKFHSYLIQRLVFFKDRIMLLRPDHFEMEQKWKQFLFDFAILRYSSEKEVSGRVTQFLKYLKEELNQVDETFEDELIEKAKEIIELDIDLLDLPIPYLFGSGELKPFLVEVNLLDFLDKFSALQELLLVRLPEALKFVEQGLSPFAEEPYHPHLNTSALILEKIYEGYQLLPKLSRLHPMDLKDFDKYFNEFILLASSFMSISESRAENDLTPRLGDVSKTINTLETLIYHYERLGKKEDELLDVDQIMNTFITGREGSPTWMGSLLTDPWGKLTLRELNRGLEFFKKAQEAHIIWDTYIESILDQMITFLAAIKRTRTTDKSRKTHLSALASKVDALRRVKASEGLIKSSSKGFSMAELAAMSDESSGKKGRRKDLKGKPSKSTSLAKAKSLAPPVAQPKKPLPKAKQPKVNLVAKTLPLESSPQLALLTNALKSPSSVELKQAAMHFKDLLAFRARQPSSISSLDFFAGVQSCYYFLEQTLASQLKTKGHNLVYLHNSLENKPHESAIVKELSLANFWTSYLYEELNQMQSLRWQPPALLKDLKRLIDDGDTSGYLDRLTTLIERSIDYATEILKPENSVKDVPLFPFHLGLSFDLDGYDKLSEKFSISSSYPSEKLKALTQQAILSLNLSKNSLERFKDKEISHLEFPHLIRQALFWHHHMAESYLKATLYERSGIHERDHDLKTLALKAGYQGKALKVFDDFTLLYQAQRYPHETEPVSLACRLVHQAEILRDHPEMDQGFQMSSKEKVLNSQEVASETLKLCKALAMTL